MNECVTIKYSREGLAAYTELTGRPEISIHAIFQNWKSTSIYFTQGKPDCAIHKMTIDDTALKPEKRISYFQAIQQEQAFIPIAMFGETALVALPSGALQQNDMGVTANSILAGTETNGAAGHVLSPWLVGELGGDVTFDAMQCAITSCKRRDYSPIYDAVAVEDIANDAPTLAPTYPEMAQQPRNARILTAAKYI